MVHSEFARLVRRGPVQINVFVECISLRRYGYIDMSLLVG